MKYLNKLIYLFVFGLVVTSCDRPIEDTDTDSYGNTLFFPNSEGILQLTEGVGGQFNIVVGATASAKSDTPYTITLDESSTALEGTDFNIISGSTVLPDGNIVTSFTVAGDFDNATLEGETAKFILTSNGAQVSDSDTFELTIFKSCPFEGLDTTSYTASVFAFDDVAPSHDVVLTPVTGTDNQWTMTSSWGPEFVAWATGNPGFSGQFPYSGTLTLNADSSISFAGNAAWATGGAGTYSPCTQEFSMTLNQGLFTTDFTVDVVLSPM